MSQPTRHRASETGLHLTTRHLAILVLYAAIIATVDKNVADNPNPVLVQNPLVVSLLVSPWLLGTLFVLLDRSGPVRNWVAPLLIVLSAPALMIDYDLRLLASLPGSQAPPHLAGLILLNLLFLGSPLLYLIRMFPKPCPSCRRRGLIPLLRLLTACRREANTHWCAFCGTTFWHQRGTGWQPERRATWLDHPPVAATPANLETASHEPV